MCFISVCFLSDSQPSAGIIVKGYIKALLRKVTLCQSRKPTAFYYLIILVITVVFLCRRASTDIKRKVRCSTHQYLKMWKLHPTLFNFINIIIIISEVLTMMLKVLTSELNRSSSLNTDVVMK